MNIWHSFSLAAFVGIVFGPLLALIPELFKYLSAPNNNWITLVLLTGRTFTLLLHSLIFAAAVSIGGMLLGVIIGSVLWRLRSSVSLYIRWLILLLITIPPYVHALAWTSSVYEISSWLKLHGLAGIVLEGWFGAWWVQLMALLPLAIGLALVGLDSVEPVLIEAGRLAQPDIVTLMKIVLPTAAPAIIAAGGFIFVLALMDYSVPSLFSKNIYALEIFAEYSASSQPARALLLSIPLLFIAVIVISISQGALRNAALNISRHGIRQELPFIVPGWLIWLQRVAVGILLVQVFIPLVSLVAAVGSWKNMVLTITSGRSEIIFSFWVACLVALLCLPLGLAVGEELSSSQRRRAFLWWFLVTIPLAVPAPLIGIGWICACNNAALKNIYASSWMPVLASLSRFTPLAAIVMLAKLRRIDPLLVEAAKIYQRNPLQGWLRVRFAMLTCGLWAAACILFALTIGELGATLLVAPPGKATLTMRIYNFLHYGASGEVAGLCLMITAMALIAGAIAVVILSGWRRFRN